MSAMDSKKRTSYLLLIIGVLVLALAGSIGYIVGDLNSKSTPVASISDNEAVMNEIEELKAMYDSKIVE
jgi:flagellar basal body-associated protein FliL